jgi:hypothetical protein
MVLSLESTMLRRVLPVDIRGFGIGLITGMYIIIIDIFTYTVIYMQVCVHNTVGSCQQ